MARAQIKKEDAKKIRQYLILTNGIIDFEAGKWYIDTPDDYQIFHSVQSMVESITEDLEIMKWVYTDNGELDDWKAIEKQAEESKFHFGGESDRIERRR